MTSAYDQTLTVQTLAEEEGSQESALWGGGGDYDIAEAKNFAFQAPCSFTGEIPWPPGLNEFFFPLNLISTLTWTTGKELEREINKNGDQLRW